MEPDEFEALKEHDRDERLAEFLNAQERRDFTPPYRIGFFSMKITFRNTEGGEYSKIASLQFEGRTLAAARFKDGMWYPSQTPLDTARELSVQVGMSLYTVEHAEQVARRLQEEIFDLLPQINFTPGVGDHVICVSTAHFGWRAIVQEVFPGPTSDPRPIYSLGLLDGEGMVCTTTATSKVLPTIEDVPKDLPHG